jgi:SAM-dependent methyltransferase
LTDNAGSYSYGSFRDHDRELERLVFQARSTVELERRILLGSGLVPGMRALDLACGPGIVSQEMARLVGAGSVVGADIDAGIIGYGQQLAAQEGLSNLELRIEDVYDMSFADGHFDFIYARLLFQHLAQPLEALRSMRRVLAPGGRACVVDVDDGLFILEPEPPELGPFMARARAGQEASGGDRFVGRKLPALFRAAGFTEVAVEIVHVGTADFGRRGFLDITTGFKLEQVPEDQVSQAQGELEAIYATVDAPEMFGTVGIFVVTGIA